MNELIKKIKKQLNFYSVLFISSCLIFLFSMIVPKAKEIYQSKVNYERKKLQLINAEQFISRLPYLTNDFLKVKQLLFDKKKHLIDSDNIGDFLKIIDDARKELKIEIGNIKPMHQSMTDPLSIGYDYHFRLLPVKIQMKSTFKELCQFLNNLFGNEKFTQLEQCKIKSETKDKDQLKIDLILLFYIKYDEVL